jgi:hypothetical protein
MPPIPRSPTPTCSHRPAQPRYILLTQSARLLAASLRAREWLCPATERLACRMQRARGQPQHDGKSEATRHTAFSSLWALEGGRPIGRSLVASKKKAQHPRSLLTLFRPAPFGDACLAFCFAFACTPVTAGRSAGSHHTPSSSSYVYCYAMNAAITMEGTICAC